jgi:hypothetical protein
MSKPRRRAMPNDKKSSRTLIIVALIGLTGTLGTALIANWEKLSSSKENGGVVTIETDNGTQQEQTQTRAALEEFEAIQEIYNEHKSETTCVEYRNMVEQIRVFDGSPNPVPESFRYTILYPSKKAMPTISDLATDRITRIKRVRSQCFK